MKVCNVCLGVPTHSGTPVISDISGNDHYLFGATWESRQVDFCAECLDLFSNNRWDLIAEKARDVLLLRLGVTEKVEP